MIETKTETTLLHELGIGTRAWHWFGRGFLVGLMVLGAANAISYFVLSEGYANLVGWKTDEQEIIGFPFEVWQRGKTYGRNLIDFQAFYKNATAGVGMGLVLGIVCMIWRKGLNRAAEKVLQAEQISRKPDGAGLKKMHREPVGSQFSIGGLMLATMAVAVIVGVATKLRPDPKVIGAIYFFAPALMISVTMLPRRWSLQFRVAALSVLAVSSIGVAIAVGDGLSMPFDEVLMGIFICWTPQGVIGTLLLLVWLLWRGGT